MSIHTAHQALIEARTSVEHELVDVQQRLARINAAITALEPDTAVPPASTGPAATRRTAPKVARKAAIAQDRKQPRRRNTTGTDWDRVATWINTARSTGTYSQRALAAEFDVPLTTAKNYLGECRRRGLLTASTLPPHPTPTAAEPVVATFTDSRYQCTSCEHTATTSRDMAHHTITAHERGPLLEERRAA